MTLASLVETISKYEVGLYQKLKEIIGKEIYFLSASMFHNDCIIGKLIVCIFYSYDPNELITAYQDTIKHGKGAFTIKINNIDGGLKDVNDINDIKQNIYSSWKYVIGHKYIQPDEDFEYNICNVAIKIIPSKDISKDEFDSKKKDDYTLMTDYNEIIDDLKEKKLAGYYTQPSNEQSVSFNHIVQGKID